MAFNVGTINDDWYLKVTAIPVAAAPLTMHLLWRQASVDTFQMLFSMDCAGPDRFMLYHRLEGQGCARARDGVNIGDAFSSGSPIALNTWHSIGGVFVSYISRYCFVDGVPGVEQTTDVTPSGMTDTWIGRDSTGSGGAASGYFAEAAVWNDALTTAEMESLAEGLSPKGVRPQNLVFCVPLVRDNHDDIVGGLSLSATGSPTVVPHPRIIHPYPPSYTKGTGAPPSFVPYPRPRGARAGMAELVGGMH